MEGRIGPVICIRLPLRDSNWANSELQRYQYFTRGGGGRSFFPSALCRWSAASPDEGRALLVQSGLGRAIVQVGDVVA